MKNQIIALAFLLAGTVSAAPSFYWDFENWTGKNNSITASSNKKYRMSGEATQAGYRGKGLRIEKKHAQAWLSDVGDWSAFTIEMKFRLDKGIDPKIGNALFCYAKNSWKRGQFLLWINSRKQVEARFTQVAGKEEFVVRSQPLNWENGRFYTVRVASQDNGALKIFLDGKLIAVQEKGAWGFNRLQAKSPAGYPLFTPGRDLADISKDFRPLNGVVDDIKVWNRFNEEPEKLADVQDAKVAVDDNTPLFVTGSQFAATGKFLVLDRPGKALGSWIRPEQKFLNAAAHAKMKLTESDLIVQIVAPIAEGTQVDRKKTRTWSGDVVEFFLRPSEETREYFQYAANASGWTTALHFSSGNSVNPDFKSKYKAQVKYFSDRWEAVFTIPRSEVKLNGNLKGHVVTANFTRTGKSGGGQSTWAPVGNNFHSISRFRPVIFQSVQTALLNKWKKSCAEFNKIQGNAQLRKSIEAELTRLESAIKKNGESVKKYPELSLAIDRMDLRYNQLHFSGITNMIWQSSLPWGNDIRISPMSRRMDKISLVLPQNSYTYTSFIFSNLTDRPFMGQLKCFPPDRLQKKQVYQSFNRKFLTVINDRKEYIDSALHANVKLFEALPLQNVETLYDPLSPLPMGTIIRAGANESRQLWMKFSSYGMKPGKQRFYLILKPSYEGFQPQEIEVEVDVRPVDLGKIALDSTHYSDVYRQGAHPNLVKFLVDNDTNIIFSGGALGQTTMDIYPKVDKNGSIIQHSDYALIDKFIDRTIAAGMKRERIKLWLVLELGTYGLNYRGKGQLKFNSPQWNKAFKNFLYHFTGHLEKKYGITKDRIFFYTIDEPDGDITKPGTKMYKAYLYGKIIKDAGKEFRTMVNPHPDVWQKKDYKAIEKLSEVYDIFEFYRPALQKDQLAVLKKMKNWNKTVWTYGIYGKTVSPDVYRREYWQSLRDGFSSVVCYWHFDNHAGSDGLNSEDGESHRTDYGSVYLDMDMGTILSSKREEAHLLGREDYKLAEYCRQLLKKSPDASLQNEFDNIIAAGAASHDMEAMEQCRLKLLAFAEKLQSRRK